LKVEKSRTPLAIAEDASDKLVTENEAAGQHERENKEDQSRLGSLI
jgi:hypothetical protein